MKFPFLIQHILVFHVHFMFTMVNNSHLLDIYSKFVTNDNVIATF